MQQLFAFRLNALVHFFYGPAYMFVMFLVQQLAYEHAPNLGGWNRDEATLLLAVCYVAYTLAFILYIAALRSFLWDGIRHGIVDQYLLKPAKPIFFVAWSKPDLAQVPLLVMSLLLLLNQLWALSEQIEFSGVFFALITMFLGLVLHYLAITTYTSLGFVMTRAEQILELFDKASDNGQYPTNIFPDSLQFVLFAVAPVAFIGYVPTQFLLGDTPWELLALECVLIGVFYVLHHFSWKYAVRSYTSVSS